MTIDKNHSLTVHCYAKGSGKGVGARDNVAPSGDPPAPTAVRLVGASYCIGTVASRSIIEIDSRRDGPTR